MCSGRPDPARNCSVSNETQTSFLLSCLPGFDGGLAQVFHLSVVQIEPSEASEASEASVVNMTSKTPTFRVSGLQSERSFSLTVRSVNSRGESDGTVVVAATTKPKLSDSQLNQAKIGSLKTRLIISPVLGVLIGVGCAIILVSITLFAIMCFRVRYERFSRTFFARTRPGEGEEKNLQDDLYVDLTDNSPDLIPNSDGESSFPAFLLLSSST